MSATVVPLLSSLDPDRFRFSKPKFPPKKAPPTAAEKAALAKAAKAAALAGEPFRTGDYGPTMFGNYFSPDFKNARCRLQEPVTVVFDPSNNSKALWLDPTKNAKIAVKLTTDKHSAEIAFLKAVQERAVERVTLYSEMLFKTPMTAEQVKACMFPLLDHSEEYPDDYTLSLKVYPETAKEPTRIANITGTSTDPTTGAVKSLYQVGDVTTVVKKSRITPDFIAAYTLWFNVGQQSSQWGFINPLLRAVVYPPLEPAVAVAKPAKEFNSDDVLQGLVDEGVIICKNTSPVKLRCVGDEPEVSKAPTLDDGNEDMPKRMRIEDVM